MDHSSFSQIIPHLFLLRKLPVQQLSSIKSEYFIIKIVNQVLLNLSVKEFQAVQHAFETWSELQKEDALDAAKLQVAIVALGPGEHLPLYVRAKNACLILSRLPANPWPSTSLTTASASGSSSQLSNSSSSQPEIGSADDIVFSTFAPALPSKQVAEAEGELLCNYPQTSIRVKRSPLLLSKAFAEQIEQLHVCPIDEATATKNMGSAILLEVQRAVHVKTCRPAQTSQTLTR